MDQERREEEKERRRGAGDYSKRALQLSVAPADGKQAGMCEIG